ncbi:MAG TPA: ACP phosphodiesterase [Chitinophagaceae bacterium]|nr:ACP phosphodiesterase [Chitinophagaceae bacterium]
MNYLAHAYLSFGDPDILLGNMIADFVKGNTLLAYPVQVRKGIRLHRAIDGFTDQHTLSRLAATFFKNNYGRYSAVFVDVVYDHFLACDTKLFPGDSLREFAQTTYGQLNEKAELFPVLFRRIFPYMKSQDWLYGYRTEEGISKAFGGIIHRAKYISDPRPAAICLKMHYAELQSCYAGFFPQLIAYCHTLRLEHS